jgi:carboxymethylenebutenolidase
MVEFASNGKTATGYLANSLSGSGPGVIVIQEWWGLVPHIMEVADRLAAAGFTALAPDLYHGEATAEPDDAGKLMMNLDLPQAARDMSGAVDFLLSDEACDSATVAAMGFCMGGGMVLWLSTIKPQVAACVPFYGVIPWDGVQPDYAASRAAYLGHYAENDNPATNDGARKAEARLRELGKEAKFHFYPGTGHAFFNDERSEVYDEAAADLAWQRSLEFMREHVY